MEKRGAFSSQLEITKYPSLTPRTSALALRFRGSTMNCSRGIRLAISECRSQIFAKPFVQRTTSKNGENGFPSKISSDPIMPRFGPPLPAKRVAVSCFLPITHCQAARAQSLVALPSPCTLRHLSLDPGFHHHRASQSLRTQEIHWVAAPDVRQHPGQM